MEDAITLLAKADVGSDIFGMDEMVIKEGLFNCMKKFIDNPEVQRRYKISYIIVHNTVLTKYFLLLI